MDMGTTSASPSIKNISSLCSKRPINRSPSNAEVFGDVGCAHAVGLEGFDFSGAGADGGFAALILSFGFSFGNTFALALQHDLALKLRHGCKHCKSELAIGGTGIDLSATKVQNAQANLL